MRNKRTLQLAQLDKKLSKFQESATVIVPDRGWIYTIRTTLNMTRRQLASRLSMSASAVQKIEEREATRQISMNKLIEAGQALNMKLVYGFVPADESIEQLIERATIKVAEKIVLRTHQNMKLEAQAINDDELKDIISDLATDLKRKMPRSIWD